MNKEKNFYNRIAQAIQDRLEQFSYNRATNHAKLIRGSVLDPLNHPSFSFEYREQVEKRHEKIAELKQQIKALQ